jgi:hypothetical protein
MRTEILTDFDAARETLEVFAAFADLDHGTVGAWLQRDTAPMRLFGVDTMVPRWIERPLDALRAFEAARREAALALEALQDWLAVLAARLASLRATRSAETHRLEREAVRLLHFEADLGERLNQPDVDLVVEGARQGVARVLEVSLGILARAVVRYADVALDGPPAQTRRALSHVENYLGFVERAAAVTGGIEVPVLRPEYVDTLRRRMAKSARGPSLRPAPAVRLAS